MPRSLRSPRHEALRAFLVERRKAAGLTQAVLCGTAENPPVLCRRHRARPAPRRCGGAVRARRGDRLRSGRGDRADEGVKGSDCGRAWRLLSARRRSSITPGGVSALRPSRSYRRTSLLPESGHWSAPSAVRVAPISAKFMKCTAASKRIGTPRPDRSGTRQQWTL
jgi:hypothetical protein